VTALLIAFGAGLVLGAPVGMLVVILVQAARDD
jgi:hypothetical protein